MQKILYGERGMLCIYERKIYGGNYTYIKEGVIMNKDLLTINDLCDELGIGKNTGYNLLKSKVIKSKKVGKRYLVHRSQLDKYIETIKGK